MIPKQAKIPLCLVVSTSLAPFLSLFLVSAIFLSDKDVFSQLFLTSLIGIGIFLSCIQEKGIFFSIGCSVTAFTVLSLQLFDILIFISSILTFAISAFASQEFALFIEKRAAETASETEKQNQDLRNEMANRVNTHLQELAALHEVKKQQAKAFVQETDVYKQKLVDTELEKGLLNENLQKLQKEAELANQSTQDSLREWRTVQGKYLQLRSQFDEKNNALDETRKELFHAEEKVLHLQQELEEKQRSVLPEIHNMEKYIVKLEKEHESKCSKYIQEINGLSKIIDNLMIFN